MEESKENRDYLQEAMDFIERYKSYLQLDEDDIQEVLIKFHKYYDPTKGTSPDTFVKLCADTHNATKWKSINRQKHKHIAIQIDKHQDNDDDEGFSNWLMGQLTPYLNQFEHDIDAEYTKEELSKYMSVLSPNQRYVIEEVYLNGRSQTEIAKDMKCSRANVYTHRKNALLKIRKKFNI